MQMYEYEWWKINRTQKIVKQELRERLLYRMPLREESLLEIINKGSLLRYVCCDVEVLEQRPSGKFLHSVHQPSRTVLLAETKLNRLWKNTPEKEDFWLCLENC